VEDRETDIDNTDHRDEVSSEEWQPPYYVPVLLKIGVISIIVGLILYVVIGLLWGMIT
jgi:hypothetical protein